MDEAHAQNRSELADRDCLLPVGGLIPAQPVYYRRVVQVAGKTVFIFEFVAESRLRPASFQIVALVIETRAVNLGNRVSGKIEQAAGVAEGIHIDALVLMLKTIEPVLPAGGPSQ